MKDTPKPIKRHASLRPLSIDHHQGLLLCWKIRSGLKKNVDPGRIEKYVSWFYGLHLAPHFRLEEQFVFPVLEPDHALTIRARAEHQTLAELAQQQQTALSLAHFADALDNHIRFEERQLFQEVQRLATPQQLKLIESMHDAQVFVENGEDVFW